MRVLLDTHAFLWLAVETELLSKNAISTLENSDTDLFLSSISIWEVQQKCQIGN